MRLSAEMFEEIVGSLRSDGRSSAEKRSEPRVGLSAEVLMISARDRVRRGGIRMRVRDISHSGVGLYHSKRLGKEQRFIVELPTIRDQPIWLVCVTAYCRRTEKDRYLIGARIKRVLNSAEVERAGRQLSGSRSDLDSNDVAEMGRISKAILS